MNNIKSTEDVLKYQLFTQLLKSAAGNDDDSQGFSAVMENAISSLSGDNSNELLSVLNEINKNLGNFEYDQDAYENNSHITEEKVKTGNSSIDDAINKASEKYNVDAKLIKSIIKQESNFNPNSVSSAGAVGLMQLMPSNAEYYGASNPFDVSQNVDAGTRLLKDYLNMYGDNKRMALAAYNAGPTGIKNKGVTDTSQFNKLPKETQNYVKKVMNYYSSQSNK